MHELKEVSKAKHWILEKYFPSWARILGQYRRLVYVDCFAGAGKYNEGEPGSPLIIFRLARELVKEKKIQGIILIFIEKDKNSAEELKKNLNSEYDGNDKIHFNVNHEDAMNFVELISDLMPPKLPAFYFIDPYGHPLSFPIIKNIIKRQKREVLFNLMWHGINRNFENPTAINSINNMFGHTQWQKHSFVKAHGEEREKLFLEYVISEIGSKFALPFKIRFGPDENVKGNRTKYYLIHFSNHPRAMLIMKQIMHSLGDEEGTFDYSATRQGILISRTPQISELKQYLRTHYKSRGIRISFEQLQIETYELPFIEKQYRTAIKEMEGSEIEVKRIKSKKTGIADGDIIIFK